MGEPTPFGFGTLPFPFDGPVPEASDLSRPQYGKVMDKCYTCIVHGISTVRVTCLETESLDGESAFD